MQGKNLNALAFFLFGIGQKSLNSFILYKYLQMMDEVDRPIGGTRLTWDRMDCRG
jgi:hypothetical protein